MGHLLSSAPTCLLWIGRNESIVEDEIDLAPLGSLGKAKTTPINTWMESKAYPYPDKREMALRKAVRFLFF